MAQLFVLAQPNSATQKKIQDLRNVKIPTTVNLRFKNNEEMSVNGYLMAMFTDLFKPGWQLGKLEWLEISKDSFQQVLTMILTGHVNVVSGMKDFKAAIRALGVHCNNISTFRYSLRKFRSDAWDCLDALVFDVMDQSLDEGLEVDGNETDDTEILENGANIDEETAADLASQNVASLDDVCQAYINENAASQDEETSLSQMPTQILPLDENDSQRIQNEAVNDENATEQQSASHDLHSADFDDDFEESTSKGDDEIDVETGSVGMEIFDDANNGESSDQIPMQSQDNDDGNENEPVNENEETYGEILNQTNPKRVKRLRKRYSRSKMRTSMGISGKVWNCTKCCYWHYYQHNVDKHHNRAHCSCRKSL